MASLQWTKQLLYICIDLLWSHVGVHYAHKASALVVINHGLSVLSERTKTLQYTLLIVVMPSCLFVCFIVDWSKREESSSWFVYIIFISPLFIKRWTKTSSGQSNTSTNFSSMLVPMRRSQAFSGCLFVCLFCVFLLIKQTRRSVRSLNMPPRLIESHTDLVVLFVPWETINQESLDGTALHGLLQQRHSHLWRHYFALLDEIIDDVSIYWSTGHFFPAHRRQNQQCDVSQSKGTRS